MKLTNAALAGFLLLGWNTEAQTKRLTPERTYRCAWEVPAQDLFRISEDDRMLEIPDYIRYRVKREELVMEVVQGGEENRFDPLTSFLIQVEAKDTPAGRLEAQRNMYGLAFTLACRPRQRDSDTAPKEADGFSVRLLPPAIPGLLEATITLYDYDNMFREHLLDSVENLAAMIQARHEALAKYTRDLSNVTGEYVKLLTAIQKDVAEFNGHLGRLQLVERRLAEIDKSLGSVLASLRQGKDPETAEFRRDLAAYDQNLRAQLQSISSELARIRREKQ